MKQQPLKVVKNMVEMVELHRLILEDHVVEESVALLNSIQKAHSEFFFHYRIDHVRAKAWSSCYFEFLFHSRNFCFMFEGKSTKEMHLKPRVVWRS